MLEIKKVVNFRVFLTIFFLLGFLVLPIKSVCAQQTEKINSQSSSDIAVVSSPEDFVIQDGVLNEYKGKAHKVILPDSIKKIGYGVFMNKSEIETVIFPESLDFIDEYAFFGCTEIREINFPDGFTHLGRLAFGGCKNIETVHLSKSFKDMGEFAVWGCDSLVYIDVDKDNEFFSSQDGILYNKDMSILLVCPGGIQGVVTLPASVRTIGEYAFFECVNVHKIITEENLVKVGDAACYGCKNLRKIVLGSEIQEIGPYAFGECTSLVEFTVGEKVKILGSGAFFECTALSKVLVLSIDVEFGHKVFAKCGNIIVEGYEGSATQAYAKKYDKIFKSISKIEVSSVLSA